ncbi:MAG: diguanylate cyclase [Atopobiaceae bacterium]|nr:diguanylate cyclase [Atopobiaceae bacterium]
MDDKRSGGIVAAVSLTIMAAFVSIALLIIHTSVFFAAQFAENLTDLYTSELLSELRLIADGQDETISLNAEELRSIIGRFWDDVPPTTVFFGEDGKVILSSSSDVAVGEDLHELFPLLIGPFDEMIAEGEDSVRLWTGLEGLLPRGQVLYEVHATKGRGIYLLTINHADGIFNTMRTRVTTLILALSVVMILLLLLVMFIVRWYRTRLMKAATTDELTGLANRKWFVSSFKSMQEEGMSQACLALIDVDKFKHVNDTYGHAAGDDALAAVAEEVRKTVGTDGLASRWGGDEFIAVLRASEEEASERTRQMIDTVAARVIDDDIHVTVSVGLAQINEGEALELAVERADDALYVTKEGGRGFLTVYHEGVTPHMSDVAAATDTVATRQQAASASSESGEAHVTAPATHDKVGYGKGARAMAKRVAGNLLTAVYKMVPFVAGGGILIALAFLIDGASVDINALGPDARANFGSITPIAAGLHDVGAAAFNFMLPIFAAFFARELAGEEAFMAGFAGGFLSSQGSAGYAGAIAAACVAAIVVNLMRGFLCDTSERLQRVAPVLLYPVFSLLIMYLLMTFVIDPVASAFDAALTAALVALEAHGHVALGAVCGAMMATDMGGPINKAAYHFGTAAIASGSPDVMAAVMVGGMVPPCGIALCTLLFGNRFSVEERDQGLATFFMGVSFITEGALPFVLTDPVRVIASCMAGSAVAGALSVASGCELMAPHGGVFVFPVVENPVPYVCALAVGSLVCAVTLGLLKPRKS